MKRNLLLLVALLVLTGAVTKNVKAVLLDGDPPPTCFPNDPKCIPLPPQ